VAIAPELVWPGVYLQEVVDVTTPVVFTAGEIMNEVSGVLFAYDPLLKGVGRLGQSERKALDGLGQPADWLTNDSAGSGESLRARCREFGFEPVNAPLRSPWIRGLFRHLGEPLPTFWGQVEIKVVLLPARHVHIVSFALH
jgi:hypothetical protein